ncbi:MAG: prephenate dehydrogenase [Streptosporangiaceae bacterium]
MAQSAATPAPARVIVIGTGLIGTYVALALRPRGVDVWLADSDPMLAWLSADLGAGTALPGDVPSGPPPGGPADVAVLAVPPQAVAPTLARAQAAALARWYTDVASVKALPARQAQAAGCDMTSFVPGHPLSGRERSGPAAARADLFLGRPWVICPDPPAPAAGLRAIAALARTCGAEPAEVTAAEHDRWVALVSHAPHVLSAAMAARLADASDGALSLAGQGLRDVTRIAAGDTGLWTQILSANAAPVADVLAAVAADLAAVAEALADTVPDPGTRPGSGTSPGAGVEGGPDLKVLAALLEQGGTGVARIPGKRGAPARAEAAVQVVIPDRPGELARLFQAAGEAGVNIEDIGIEHSPGLPVGVAELTVHPEAVGRLTEALAANGWPVRR